MRKKITEDAPIGMGVEKHTDRNGLRERYTFLLRIIICVLWIGVATISIPEFVQSVLLIAGILLGVCALLVMLLPLVCLGYDMYKSLRKYAGMKLWKNKKQ
jgi:hypothetical protein